MKRRYYVLALILLLGVTLGASSTSAQGPGEIRFTCSPSQITSFDHSLWIRCDDPAPGTNVTAFASPWSSPSTNGHLALVMTAMQTGKQFEITFNPSDSPPSYCNIPECRPILWTNLFD